MLYPAGLPMKSYLLAMLVAVAAGLYMPCTASADLIYDSNLGGQASSGLGTVSTILTMQGPGSGTFESGSVERSSGADVKSDTGVLEAAMSRHRCRKSNVRVRGRSHTGSR